MTRATLFRVILAMAMLPNFTAYWWLLPRRMKRCRTRMQAMMQISARYQQRHWADLIEKATLFYGIYDGKVAPISERYCRIPISFIGGH